MEVGVLRRDGRTDPFFDGAAAERLMIRRCAGCARWYAPDAGECPECGAELDWAEASGRATLVSWAFAYGRPARRDPSGEAGGAGPSGSAASSDSAGPSGATDADGSGGTAPAVLALVELAEGPWLHTRLDGVARAALREGLPLAARFVHPAEGESYVIFRASPGSSDSSDPYDAPDVLYAPHRPPPREEPTP